MTKLSISIYFPDDENLQTTLNKLIAYKKTRAQVSEKVLCHVVSDADWIIFDEILTMDYKRLQDLLKILDERAG